MKYWNHYEFKSGSNPYCTMTTEADKKFLARCKKRGWAVSVICETKNVDYFLVNDRPAAAMEA